MSQAQDLQNIPELPSEIIQAGINNQLVIFVGAGASIILGYPSWSMLASYALEEVLKAKLLNYDQREQLKGLEPKKCLSILMLIAADKRYHLDLTKHFIGKTEGNSIYKSINDIGCPCVTTNYDELLAPRFNKVKKGEINSKSVQQQNTKRVIDRDSFFTSLLQEPGTVIHLHGAISKPDSMIVTTAQYLEHYEHEQVRLFLTELFDKKVVLFIGYGLDETEILEYILRKGDTKQTPDRRRFALQGYFKSQDTLYKNLHRYYADSYGVNLVGFVRDDKDYAQQEDILQNWGPQIKISSPTLVSDLEQIIEVLSDE